MSHWGSDGAGAPALHKGLQVDCSAPECACACEDVVHDSDCPQALPNQLLIADVSDSAVWTASRVYNESVREGASHPVAMHAALMAVARRPASRDELAAEVRPIRGDTMTNFRANLTASGGVGTTVEVDGFDITKTVRGLRIDAHVGSIPTVEVELLFVNGTGVDAEAIVRVPDATAEALVALGWKPPAE
jgi:hypothetical protein